MTTASGADRRFEYEVALSFAGEDREVAARLARHLESAGVAVFYDKFNEASLWGKNLSDYLASVYSERARFCVMILSRSYVRKAWPNYERQHAQARAINSSSEYILPLKLEDVEVPGLASTVAYIDLRNHDIDRVVELILQKISASNDVRADEEGLEREPLPTELSGLPDVVTAPYRDRDTAWEYLLFRNMLGYELESSRDLKANLEYGLPRNKVRRLDFLGYNDWNSNQTSTAQKKVPALTKLVNVGFLRAIGRPGEPGDPIEIYTVAKKIGEIYRWLLEWALEFHSIVVDEDVERLMGLHSKVPVGLLETIERMHLELDEQLGKWLAFPPDERPRPYRFKIDLTLEYPHVDEIVRETKKLARAHRVA